MCGPDSRFPDLERCLRARGLIILRINLHIVHAVLSDKKQHFILLL